VIRSQADGYTLLQLAASAPVNQAVNEKLSFNILTDLAMVAGTITSPLVLVVHPSLPANTVPELIAYAKANPGKIALASYGTESGSRKSAQGDKWNFCLTAGTLCLRIRSDHEETTAPEPHTGLQGEGGPCGRQR
jgi:Tripartite tricarboxylate transporter family receptor